MLRYRFDNKLVDCKPESCPKWQKISSVFGACCSFNFYPKPSSRLNATIINQVGKLGGMTILFSSKHLPASGLSLIITNPGGYIMPYDSASTLFPGFENFFRLYFKRYLFHPNFEHAPYKTRRCMLSRRNDDRWNSYSWCILNHTLEIIYKECDCHPYYMPNVTEKSASMRNCTVKDLLCFRDKPGTFLNVLFRCFPLICLGIYQQFGRLKLQTVCRGVTRQISA